MSDMPLGIPDWVLVGAPARDGNGVIVLASRELGAAELEVLRHRESYPWEPVLQQPPRQRAVVLHANVKSYMYVQGRTYAEALARLQQDWQPEPPARVELDAGAPSLEAGDADG